MTASLRPAIDAAAYPSPLIRSNRGPSSPATSTTPIDDTHHTAKCQHCCRPIWAVRSVTREAGPTCWRRNCTNPTAAAAI